MSFFGDPAPAVTKSSVELSPEQKELYGLAMPGFRQYAANPPQRFPGTQVAGFDPLQSQGQGMALGATGAQTQLAGDSADANRFLLRDALDPATNPALRSTIEASTRPIYEGLTEKALPAIRGEAVKTGNFGSSRQGIAEGLASREASRAAGDVASKVATHGYDTGLNAMLKALALTPNTQAAQLSPAATTSAVGDTRQAMQQALLSEQASGWTYDQLLPFLMSSDLASIAGGLPVAGATNVATGPKANPLSQGLGLASTGLGLASSLGSLATSLGPLLALSEPKLKTDRKLLHRLDNGMGIWSYKFLGSPRTEVGLMADEVEAVVPSAVHEIAEGVRAVDYGAALEGTT